MAGVPERLTVALADRYRIERELGAGGMATVYLAEDLKHDRKVALKVLKPELAAVLGAERFVVEIKTTASLQHPHILPLFDSGTADGFLFYVMPFIEGETLRDRLNRETQLGVEDAIRLATEVADALDYAHRRGVIHRDIKPENILLHDGRPMVADFGIALAVSAAAGGRMTETGLSLGTPHYMSPEQATADKEITGRADIYSLASVLYEMLTGSPPHVGSSAQQIIMKIIADAPRPVTELRKAVPANVAAVVAKALEKLPADRFESAKAFAEALKNPAFSTGLPAATGAVPSGGVRLFGRDMSWRAVAAVLGAACVALIAFSAWTLARRGGTTADPMVTRAEIDILTETDSGVLVDGLDVSPDGSMFVFSAVQRPDTSFRLYLRRLDERAAHAVPGTEGGQSPAFSPDGQSIAFVYSGREIRRAPLTGVVIETVAQGTVQEFPTDLRWAPDGYIYYDVDGGAGLTRVRAEGGTPQVLVGGDPAKPDPLPDGRHVLYTECCSDSSDVRVVDANTGTTQSLGVSAAWVRYLPTGHLLLGTSGGLKAVEFDVRRRAVRGDPVPVLDSVTANGTVRDFALSTNGMAVYTVRVQASGSSLVTTLVGLDGGEERLALPAGNYRYSRFSPDGRRLAFQKFVQQNDSLFVYDLLLGTTTRLLGRDRVDGILWTPDGKQLLVSSRTRSSAALVSMAVDGSGAEDTLLSQPLAPPTYGVPAPLSFSPDGRRILMEKFGRIGDLLSAQWDSTLGPVSNYLAADWVERDGRISPDGRWVAYESDEERAADPATRWRIYVRSFPEPGERFTVSDGSGLDPRWSPDGRTIYYWRGQTLVAASVRTDPGFAVTGRRDLFTRPTARTYGYDVHPDGKRFVMALTPASAADGAASTAWVPFRLVLVSNWLEEFRRKVEDRR